MLHSLVISTFVAKTVTHKLHQCAAAEERPTREGAPARAPNTGSLSCIAAQGPFDVRTPTLERASRDKNPRLLCAFALHNRPPQWSLQVTCACIVGAPRVPSAVRLGTCIIGSFTNCMLCAEQCACPASAHSLVAYLGVQALI